MIKNLDVLIRSFNNPPSIGIIDVDRPDLHDAILVGLIVADNSDICWKTKDVPNTLYNGRFMLGIETPEGTAIYAFERSYWTFFNCKILDTFPDIYRNYDVDNIRCLKRWLLNDKLQ